MAEIILVLGGARSGKTSYALAQAAGRATAAGVRPVMIATAQAFDDEMAGRIDRHRAERAEGWDTIEAPLDIAAAIADLPEGAVAVLDCLTLWLSNLMLAEHDLAAERERLLETLANCRADLWLVSNEVGWGIVPDNPLARRFRDEAGWLHQAIAARADGVVLVVAGLPMPLKSGA